MCDCMFHHIVEYLNLPHSRVSQFLIRVMIAVPYWINNKPEIMGKQNYNEILDVGIGYSRWTEN